MISTGLKRAAEKRAENKALGIKVEIKDPITKAYENPKSLRLAINGKCWDCVGAGWDTHPRQAIRECLFTECTLHSVRPYQNKED